MKGFFPNPVIIKEVRERFRTGKTAWILGAYLFIMGTILLGFIYLGPYQRSFFRPGESREMFTILSVIQLGMIGFIAPALTAGTISGERERQTLNILLTTHLTPFSIVASKLLTSLAFIGLLLVSSLPLYSFVFLYGGNSPEQLVKVFIFFAVNMVFFGSLGAFCSAWFKRTGVSTIVAYCLTFFIGVGSGFLVYFLWEFYRMMEWEREQSAFLQILAALNPGFVLGDILGEKVAPFPTYPVTPWILFSVVYLVMSILFVIAATNIVNPLRKRFAAKS
ncbi:ABC transporter permease [Ammoniphilus sp. CFH 90114]|uniref:ABC transporter permease n=1 Tax=Ammoniphilus sp. CFH 90114 TaxID=2493665 RepID=UPI00100FEEF3|nr:ABC transporter permease subunit [Ammoniphilus sp. CFH 90114]RXT13527.1 ABC transporter permease [Ammoniphilus sp. CFH 90114]